MKTDPARGILIPSWAEIEAALDQLTPPERNSTLRVQVLPLAFNSSDDPALYNSVWRAPTIALESRPTGSIAARWEWFVTEMPEFHL